MPTENELLAREEKDYIRCACNNVIPISSIYCPYCRVFNRSTSAEKCPTCGQDLPKEAKIPEV